MKINKEQIYNVIKGLTFNNKSVLKKHVRSKLYIIDLKPEDFEMEEIIDELQKEGIIKRVSHLIVE